MGRGCWWREKGDFTGLCKALLGYYRYQSAVSDSGIKRFSSSFTAFCLYLIPVTHHKTRIRLKSTFQTFGCLCNTTPGVAEAAWSAPLSLSEKKTTSMTTPCPSSRFPPLPHLSAQIKRRALLCGSMAASQAQRAVNIYPGLPRTGLINEKKKARLST